MTLLSKYRLGDLFKILRPSQNIWTLSPANAADLPNRAISRAETGKKIRKLCSITISQILFRARNSKSAQLTNFNKNLGHSKWFLIILQLRLWHLIFDCKIHTSKKWRISINQSVKICYISLIRVLKCIRWNILCWKLPELKIVRIESCQNWKLPKLKVAKIESCQNWKLSKLKVAKIESCQSWKWIQHFLLSSQVAKLLSCQIAKLPSCQIAKLPSCQIAQL